MKLHQLKAQIARHPFLKKWTHWLLVNEAQKQPRGFTKWFVNPFIHTVRGKIKSKARLDVFPFQPFSLGLGATIEDFSVINNGVGQVVVGSGTRIGIGNVLIGPVEIGKDCLLAQQVVISGLNHKFENTQLPIRLQGVETKPVLLKEGCWIGAHATILPGVTIGKNAVVGAGSVVTKDVPDFTVAVGNPARIVKKLSKGQRMETALHAMPTSITANPFPTTVANRYSS